jgi:UDP-N-acetylglucosamine--N-acetylmuramyl-(pentapeptide) pyrophosphoryl-undecaprenol N-acetylglucosamine transferase
MLKNPKIIISGGGTGGHIFPAISIADAIKKANPNAEILFVGAKGRMEMERVPLAGYAIASLPVAGFIRKLTFKNFIVLHKLLKSICLAKKIVRLFEPDVVIGVGGYASFPALHAAAAKKIPILIQEQNSFPGKSNLHLAKHATKICVAYPEMEKYFPKEKIVLTGNPVRKELTDNVNKNEAYQEFELNPNKKTILAIGGSLGAGSINKGIQANLNMLKNSNIQMVWQTGKIYYDEIIKSIDIESFPNLKIMPFIQRMDFAYSVADIVISRAGASSISELSVTAKPAILVPSPNVAEDHQKKNAMALVKQNAAILISDSDTSEKLLPEAIETVQNNEKLEALSNNIKKMAKYHAADEIAEIAIKLII